MKHIRTAVIFALGFVVALVIFSASQVQAAATCPTTTPVRTVPTSAATAAADDENYGTQDNPVPLGVNHALSRTVTDGSGGTSNKDIRVKLTKVTRGKKAFSAVMAANPYNTPPTDGSEFVIVQVAITYDSGVGPLTINYDDFSSLSDGELKKTDYETSVSNEFGQLGEVKLLPKGHAEHVVVIEVKTADTTPLIGIAVSRDGNGGVFFALQ